MVDPILTEMYRIALSGESEAVRVVAAKDLLDRAGYKPKERMEQSGKVMVEVVYGEVSDTYLSKTPTLGSASDQV